MNRNATPLCTVIFTVTIFFTNINIIFAQCVAPGMQFTNPVLVAGTASTIGARYKFLSVIANVDAIVTVTDIVGGASLKSIDDNTFGYSEAWQPVVKTPLEMGAVESYVKFRMDFVNSTDETDHTFICFTMSAIDVDGDNDRVREMIAANDYTSYAVSNVTTLSLLQQADLMKATSTIVNFPGIDTSAYITNINYRYISKSRISEIRIGSRTEETFIPQDRYSCIYFRPVNIPNVVVLPAQYLHLNTVGKEKKVILNWQTNQEVNIQSIVLERSFNGSNFSPINTIIQDFKKDNLNSYQAIDASVEIETKSSVYYRIKQTNASGKVSYSNLSNVQLSPNFSSTKMETSPNPFVEKLKVQFRSEVKGNAEIQLLSLTGLNIGTKKMDIAPGINNFYLEGLASKPAGLYIARLIMNGEVVETKKIIK